MRILTDVETSNLSLSVDGYAIGTDVILFNEGQNIKTNSFCSRSLDFLNKPTAQCNNVHKNVTLFMKQNKGWCKSQDTLEVKKHVNMFFLMIIHLVVVVVYLTTLFQQLRLYSVEIIHLI
jgi:hypothetical protein